MTALPNWRQLCARVLLLGAAWAALASWQGPALVRALLPALAAELPVLDDTYGLQSVALAQDGADQVVRIVVWQVRCIVLQGQAYCGDPRGRASASTLIAHVSLPAVLLLTLVSAWPARCRMEWAWRLLWVPLALVLWWALDVPFVLWAALWRLHVEAFAPDLFSPLLVWAQCLQGGGRLALPLLLGAAVLRLSWYLSRRQAACL
jgi:hypothetical protein